MTYQPNIPLSNDKISQSQVDLLQNFQQLNTRFAQDHVSFSTGTNSGFHKQVTIPTVLGADPVVASPAGVFYTKAVAGITEAFFRNQTTVTQLTGLPSDIVGNGSVTFANGFIIKWGTMQPKPGNIVDNQFFFFPDGPGPMVGNEPFPTNIFAVVVFGIKNTTGIHSLYLKDTTSTNFNVDGFNVRSDDTWSQGFMYIAIGN
jgi:hypothetical protein